MKLGKKHLTLSLVLMLSMASNGLKAQGSGDFTDIFEAPAEDMSTYLENYMRPAVGSFANGQVGGWYNTAKTHKPLGFDLTFTLNMANIPTGDRSFLFDESQYENLRLQGGADHVPTFVGDDTDETLGLSGTYIDPASGVEYSYGSGALFDAPDPLINSDDLPVVAFPVPTLQLGIGLIKNTDLKIRYMGINNMDVDGYTISINQLGFGVMHDVKQWIPGIKHIPIDISGFIGYSRFKAEVEFDESRPGEYSAVGSTELVANTTTFQVLASKKLLFFTPYIGLGYNFISSNLSVKGDFVNYELTDASGNPYVFTDPVDVDFNSSNSFKATIGARIKLAVITLHADYTVQDYDMLTIGLGVSVR